MRTLGGAYAHSGAAMNVLGHRHHLQVVGVYAPAIAAEMVYGVAVWNWAMF